MGETPKPPPPGEPFFFGPPARPLQSFGIYDGPAGPVRRGGVLLCDPVGDDAVRAHRPLRHLAQRLSRAGFAVLRFDFHGTGDSAGDERLPDRVPTWLDDVRVALAELRARCGPGPISVVGLRLGATLALCAGADVDGVVLWGPFARGAAYRTDSTRLYKMHKMLEPQGFAGEAKVRPDGEEAFGFLLTHDTLAGLSTLDVRAPSSQPARRVLVLGDGSGAAGEQEIVDHLSSLGVPAERRVVPGSRQFLIEVPHKSRLPESALETIVHWLCDGNDGGAAPAVTPAARARASGEAPAHRGEIPVRFGARGALFGILHEPATPDEPPPGLPPIVLTSAGTVHRIGPHRFYVSLARRWAKLGFRVLRVDLSGIGDSPPGDDGVENVTYPRDGYDDIRAAMDLLTARAAPGTAVTGDTHPPETPRPPGSGAGRFVLAGLCSGGDFAFQMGMRDPRVETALILNPRTFCVNDLAEVETGNFAAVVAAAAGALGEAVPVPVSLRRMVERGVDTLLVVTEKDPGVHYVDTRWGDQMQALAGLPGFVRHDVPGTDHNFTSIWAQERVSDLCTEHLRRRYLS